MLLHTWYTIHRPVNVQKESREDLVSIVSVYGIQITWVNVTILTTKYTPPCGVPLMEIQIPASSIILRSLGTRVRDTVSSPTGALSNISRSYWPWTPHLYIDLSPQSHWTTTALPPSLTGGSPTSTTVPTWPSPPSWSPHCQSGPRTTRRPTWTSMFRGQNTPGWTLSTIDHRCAHQVPTRPRNAAPPINCILAGTSYQASFPAPTREGIWVTLEWFLGFQATGGVSTVCTLDSYKILGHDWLVQNKTADTLQEDHDVIPHENYRAARKQDYWACKNPENIQLSSNPSSLWGRI